mmetsp:Transcript_27456/g.68975  ORF Transcript_27456/g.68975 Transcript_27456/m.68975 type:complete len:145 (-) Transcript_27456:72-506(-)
MPLSSSTGASSRAGSPAGPSGLTRATTPRPCLRDAPPWRSMGDGRCGLLGQLRGCTSCGTAPCGTARPGVYVQPTLATARAATRLGAQVVCGVAGAERLFEVIAAERLGKGRDAENIAAHWGLTRAELETVGTAPGQRVLGCCA